jgi:hypothetical protein
MSMDIKGRLIQILPLQSGTSKTGNGWSKQEFVIESDEQFPKKVCFTLFGDKVSLLNGLSIGNQIEVAFNLESREFNGKWYSNINAWKVNPVQIQNAASSDEYSIGNIPPPPEPYDAESGNDLPF